MCGSLLIRNISRLVTMAPGPSRDGPLGVIENAALRVRGGRIVWLGPDASVPLVHSHERVIDVGGCVVMPGLVDCHTHIVHAEDRAQEFNKRSMGVSYQEIAAAGGGIMSTVRATRAASREELLMSAAGRLRESFSKGVTTVEIKTGYGLDYETEMRMVEVIKSLKEAADQDISGAFLGAHIVPEEYKDDRLGYIEALISKMLPKAAASGVISACDVFVEDNAYTADEAREIAAAAKNLGLAMRLHVDQFSDVGGGELAAEIGAISADHLDRTNEEGMKAMAKAGVIGVILPTASLFAHRGGYPDARKMIDLGMQVAVSTDYNPGTSPTLDLLLAATVAVTQTGLTCDEALLGITKNAARAMGLSDRGHLSEGTRADIVIFDTPHEHIPLYRFGSNLVKKVIANGCIGNSKFETRNSK